MRWPITEELFYDWALLGYARRRHAQGGIAPWLRNAPAFPTLLQPPAQQQPLAPWSGQDRTRYYFHFRNHFVHFSHCCCVCSVFKWLSWRWRIKSFRIGKFVKSHLRKTIVLKWESLNSMVRVPFVILRGNRNRAPRGINIPRHIYCSAYHTVLTWSTVQ